MTRDPGLISLGRRPRPTGRAVPVTPATRSEIDRVNERLRIEAFFSSHSRLTYLMPYLERITITESWCWEWPHRQANGYPTARSHIAGQPQVAIHRLVASAAHGEIPAGWFACHRCDNRPCVNPEHLFIGSPGDNTRDMFAKGRGRPRTERGEKHGRATVSDATVLEALVRVHAGESLSSVARSIGVDPASVSNWRKGATRSQWLPPELTHGLLLKPRDNEATR